MKAITEWREVFLMGATVHFIGITIYGIFASGELQPWAEPTGPYESPIKPKDHETTFVSHFGSCYKCFKFCMIFSVLTV